MKLSEDYFLRIEESKPATKSPPMIRVVLHILKNFVGIVIILVGGIMSLTPSFAILCRPQ